MKIGVILDQIDLGSMALPEFQRGYVWNRDQVRGLMESLYRKHPVGDCLYGSPRAKRPMREAIALSHRESSSFCWMANSA